VGIVFYDKANDGAQFFNHMKFCMGNILFHTFTQSMVQVLACMYIYHTVYLLVITYILLII
jgi:hypothetical protein